MIQKGIEIPKPKGKLGVLLPGLGAVSTTFIAGVHAVIKAGITLTFLAGWDIQCK